MAKTGREPWATADVVAFLLLKIKMTVTVTVTVTVSLWTNSKVFILLDLWPLLNEREPYVKKPQFLDNYELASASASASASTSVLLLAFC